MAELTGLSSYPAVMQSPLPGNPCLGIKVTDGKLVAIDLLGSSCTPCAAKDSVAQQAALWLERYFSHAPLDEAPPLPLQPQGTAFQQRVWRRLRRIPTGQVMRYGELAKELGSSARAVAGACRANPIPILIPCHRVVAVHGLGGYMGETGGEALQIKQWLLQHEHHV